MTLTSSEQSPEQGNHMTTSSDWRVFQPGRGLLAVTAYPSTALRIYPSDQAFLVEVHEVLAVRITVNRSRQPQYKIPSWSEDRWIDGESVLALTFGLANGEWVDQVIERLQQMQGGAW